MERSWRNTAAWRVNSKGNAKKVSASLLAYTPLGILVMLVDKDITTNGGRAFNCGNTATLPLQRAG